MQSYTSVYCMYMYEWCTPPPPTFPLHLKVTAHTILIKHSKDSKDTEYEWQFIFANGPLFLSWVVYKDILLFSHHGGVLLIFLKVVILLDKLFIKTPTPHEGVASFFTTGRKYFMWSTWHQRLIVFFNVWIVAETKMFPVGFVSDNSAWRLDDL